MSRKNYIKSVGVVSFSTLASRILGMIRDICMASMFGAGWVLDAFVMAFTLPNLFRRFFGEGAVSSAFIPVFSEVLEKDGKKKAGEFAAKAFTLLVLVLLGLVALGVICCFGLQFLNIGVKERLTLKLAAIMMPYLLLICITAFFAAMLNALHHFLCPALAPLVLNIFWLIGIFAIAPLMGGSVQMWAYGMAIAIVVGGIFQLLLQLPALRHHGLSVGIHFDPRDVLLKKVCGNLLPVMVGAAVVQINVLLDRMIAWFMIPGDGALTVLYMGNRLMQFPLAIIGISLATVVFPIFTGYAIRHQRDKFSKAVPEALRFAFFLALPASVGMAVLARPIITLIYQHNRFTEMDSIRTTHVLIAYCSGLWLYILLQIITKAFYALGNTKTPTKLAMCAMLGNFLLNLALVPFWQETGLAAATAINAFFHCGIMLYILNRLIPLEQHKTMLFLIKSSIATALMAVSVLYAVYLLQHSHVAMQVFLSISIAIPIYFLASLVLGLQEVQHFTRLIFRK